MEVIFAPLKAIFYTPLFNLLVALYEYIPGSDLGVAIVLLTLLVRLLTYPLNASSLRSQKALQSLQPKLKALQEQYKDDREKLARETMALYASEKVSPFASCLPVLLQLPFLIALYHVLRDVLAAKGFEVLYAFVPHPGTIESVAFGFVDLARASVPLAIVAGLTQFVQAKMLATDRPPQPPAQGAKDEDMLATMNKQMVYVMPVITTVIAWSLPAGLAMYWITMNLLAIFQQWIMFKKKNGAAVSAAKA